MESLAIQVGIVWSVVGWEGKDKVLARWLTSGVQNALFEILTESLEEYMYTLKGKLQHLE